MRRTISVHQIRFDWPAATSSGGRAPLSPRSTSQGLYHRLCMALDRRLTRLHSTAESLMRERDQPAQPRLVKSVSPWSTESNFEAPAEVSGNLWQPAAASDCVACRDLVPWTPKALQLTPRPRSSSQFAAHRPRALTLASCARRCSLSTSVLLASIGVEASQSEVNKKQERASRFRQVGPDLQSKIFPA